jgi:hypothetical protein
MPNLKHKEAFKAVNNREDEENNLIETYEPRHQVLCDVSSWKIIPFILQHFFFSLAIKQKHSISI